ncbi:hypothetical protein [Kushneria marisflavi]|uniref:hypothetical protein n=1 Tax=Kushneria marisflavi TaxID=157779 RepID=UPI000E760D27|nr:hypothetical protein [Kushneria marisflavi]RKD75782.1 hypothetical protein C8D96_3356 [Kushneria marisflavi]
MGRPTAGIKWAPKVIGDQTYDLSHLHPDSLELVIPAKGKNPERRFSIAIAYGLHCFTRKPNKDEQVPDDYWYQDSREKRVFCLMRWELSYQLPDIIRTLGRRKCLHTKGEEFVTIEMVYHGREIEYAVFFTVTKGDKSGADINLFINSGHERYNKLQYTKPIGFHVIVMNRYANKPIKKP